MKPEWLLFAQRAAIIALVEPVHGYDPEHPEFKRAIAAALPHLNAALKAFFAEVPFHDFDHHDRAYTLKQLKETY